jgi:hypothetical protein
VTSLAEIVATVVVHSSSAALSHFGVMVTPPATSAERPAPAERVVARSPRPADKVDCPAQHRVPAHTPTLKA